MHQGSTARAALAAFAFGLAFAIAPLPAPATPAAIEIPVTAKVTVKVPGKYFFRFELIDLDDGGAVRWSEEMDRLGKKRELSSNKLTHTLGSLWKSYGANTPLDPALFEHQLWLRVSSFKNNAWVPCSGNLRLNIVSYAVWSALSAGTGDEVITTYMIQDGAVTGGKLADDAVTTGKIADGAVTFDKLDESCGAGETLLYGPQGWACGTCFACREGDFLYCYHAPFATLNVGPCRPGVRACTPAGTGFDAACVGEVLPAPDTCNEVDDDCDGVVDNPTTGDGGVLLYRDADADSFGETSVFRTFCGSDHAGWVAADADCDDASATIFPGATELCDCEDNDCDTAVDEECMVDTCTTAQISSVMFCLVSCGDDDGCRMGCFESLGTCGTVLQEYISCLSEHEFPCMPLDFECASGYCDTTNLLPHPGCACGATQPCGDTPDNVGICRKGTQACVDGKWDGACVGAVLPGYEICENQLDDDCDGAADEAGGTEFCDGEDNDCDGDVDVDAVGAVACIVPPGPSCDAAAKSAFDACIAGCGESFDCVSVCGLELQECGSERAQELGNCAEGSCVSPGPEEQPLFDPDCFTSPGLCKGPYDLLFTGEPGECLHGATQGCGTDVGPCEFGTQTCDHGRWGGCAGGVGPVGEICGDEIDNDCNGTVDDGAADADDDGVSFCDGDCDDGDNTVYPGADEVCDGRDNDCDREVDGWSANASCPNDGDLCTSEPYCEEGQCVLPPVSCEDGDDCTIDTCAPATGECTYARNLDDPACADCGDGACTAGENVISCFDDCNPCPTMDCDDHLDCTADSCDPWIGSCINEPDDGVCSNGDFCDGIETCVPGSAPGTGCQEGTPVDCNDGFACTTDSCNPADGVCANETHDELCNDNDVCNGSEICSNGLGCMSVGSPLNCDDTNACNGSETCDPLSGCQAGVPVVCDDGIDCTVDDCDPSTGGCDAWPDDESCFDLDDCTIDSCDPGVGCISEPDLGCSCGNFVCEYYEDLGNCPADCTE